jgi:eukaryotic-like serine/threonine-protein kinase
MSRPWEERWLCDPQPIHGGQSTSYVALSKDGRGTKAFIKTLSRPRVDKARRRFRREAVAYETLTGLGPPKLFEHNADTWPARGEPMYMALEYIDGVDLGSFVRRNGAVDPESALHCTRELAGVVHRCHEHAFLHRDIKPSNIMLRGGRVASPVLVDFGLSFNDAEEDDLTRVGEEVGNRFLRLPEHGSGIRSAASDVTQLGGVFLYLLTAIEPRVLVDESRQMPHQRSAVHDALSRHFRRRKLLRVKTVFDTVFDLRLDARYQTASDFLSALDNAMRDDRDDGADQSLEVLLERVDEIALTDQRTKIGIRNKGLDRVLFYVRQSATLFAQGRYMKASYGRNTRHVEPEESWADENVTVTMDGHPPITVPFRVESRGQDEHVVLVDGGEIWRGRTPNDGSLKDTVTAIFAQRLLDSSR